MWQRIEEIIIAYCFGVFTRLSYLIENSHPTVAIGLPILATIAVQQLLPTWVFAALTMLVWIPVAAVMVVVLFVGLMQTRR